MSRENEGLAYIASVNKIEPIVGADNIETVRIRDWVCVVKKGEFKIGDLGVYFEVDSILPQRPEFEFMKERKYRIRTIKLRGQISQGLFMPLTVLPKGKYKEDYDVTQLLGVTKYEPEITIEPTVKRSTLYKFIKNIIMKNKLLKKLFGYIYLNQSKDSFPTYILPKTDEERIQNIPWIYEHLKGRTFYITIKMDGQSGTFGIHKGEYIICSRNIKVYSSKKSKTSNTSYYEMSIKYEIEKKLRSIYRRTGKEYFIQGEICGPSIQKNRMGLIENELYVFNVYNVTDSKFLNFDELKKFTEQNNFKMVPLVLPDTFKDKHYVGCWKLVGYDFQQFMELAESQKYGNGTPAEGIVVRTIEEEVIPRLGRFSFKVISNKFLLKYEL